MRIIETIDGVHRIEDDGADPVEWLEAHDTGEPGQLDPGRVGEHSKAGLRILSDRHPNLL
jgi:hypothetical protein